MQCYLACGQHSTCIQLKSQQQDWLLSPFNLVAILWLQGPLQALEPAASWVSGQEAWSRLMVRAETQGIQERPAVQQACVPQRRRRLMNTFQNVRVDQNQGPIEVCLLPALLYGRPRQRTATMHPIFTVCFKRTRFTPPKSANPAKACQSRALGPSHRPIVGLHRWDNHSASQTT